MELLDKNTIGQEEDSQNSECTIEQTNTWINSHKILLIRFDKSTKN